MANRNPWAGLTEEQRAARRQRMAEAAKARWTPEAKAAQAAKLKAYWTPERRAEASRQASTRSHVRDSKSARLDFGSRQANGRLTLYERVSRADIPPSSAMWLAKCDCGRWAGVRADRFIAEKTRSCGCLAIRAAERAVSRAQGRLRKAEATVVERHAIMARLATERGYD